MSADWLDRAARAADERVSRRRLLQQTGIAALTVGPLAALLRAGSAQAAPADASSTHSKTDDCLPQCLQNARDALDYYYPRCSALAAYGGLVSAALGFVGWGCAMGGVNLALAREASCYEPNCGQSQPPPKEPPPPEPLPPDLSQLPPSPPRPKKKPKKKKKKKSPLKKQPSPPKKPDWCQHCKECCPSAAFGWRCCDCCDKSGDGCGTAGNCAPSP